MKHAAAIVLVAIGAILALYVGGWIMFVGGIAQVIDAIRADVLDSLAIAIGIGKVVFCSLVGWLIFGVFGLVAKVIAD